MVRSRIPSRRISSRPIPNRPISSRVHGLIDYAAGAALAATPDAMGWHGPTRRLMHGAAVGSAAYALATDYEFGAVPLLSLDQHLAIDAAQGLGFLAAAALLTDAPRSARFVMAGYGLFALTVATLTERRPRAAAEADLIRREDAARLSMAGET